MRETIQLLGEDHVRFGELRVAAQAEGRTAVAISAGSDAPSGAAIFKADLPVPNEDAGGAVDDGEATLLIVADGHHGHRASHALVRRALSLDVPRDALELLGALRHLAGGDAHPDASASTLMLAVLDRRRRRGFGASFGDSSLTLLRRGARPIPLSRKDDRYVTPWAAPTLDPRRAHEFEFDAPPGSLLVAYTDGVDECCYGTPERSLGLGDIADVLERVDAREQDEPQAFVEQLARAALRGAQPDAGGQDNIAIVASRA